MDRSIFVEVRCWPVVSGPLDFCGGEVAGEARMARVVVAEERARVARVVVGLGLDV